MGILRFLPAWRSNRSPRPRRRRPALLRAEELEPRTLLSVSLLAEAAQPTYVILPPSHAPGQLAGGQGAQPAYSPGGASGGGTGRASQIFTVPSPSAVARRCPSALKATEVRCTVCPLRVRVS